MSAADLKENYREDCYVEDLEEGDIVYVVINHDRRKKFFESMFICFQRQMVKVKITDASVDFADAIGQTWIVSLGEVYLWGRKDGEKWARAHPLEEGKF